MLEFKLNEGTGVLEVTERLISFHGTRTTFWYYDTRNWTKSSMGKKDEVPTRKMTEEDIAWVTKHYLKRFERDAEFDKKFSSASGASTSVVAGDGYSNLNSDSSDSSCDSGCGDGGGD